MSDEEKRFNNKHELENWLKSRGVDKDDAVEAAETLFKEGKGVKKSTQLLNIRSDQLERLGVSTLLSVELSNKLEKQHPAKHPLAFAEPPPKRMKIRDSRGDKVEASKCIDLDVGKVKILTPADSDNVRYYGRDGMSDLFSQLIDSREDNQDEFNLEFIGAPGTGKSNLVWAAAEHMGLKENVVWAGRRYKNEPWTVIQFFQGGVYSFENVPKTLSEIIKFPEFANTSVLILDTPITISDDDERDNGAAAYSWASNTGIRGSRVGSRRVIHVSSLGASTEKSEERRQLSLLEILISPWVRQDYIKSMNDQKLKQKVCETLGISDASTISAEDLVDRKFFYSGINARWFFNYSIDKIVEECKVIVARLSPSTTDTGDRHREAVNSALQRYWLGNRRVVLFTSSYLASIIGESGQTKGHQRFLENFPLIRDWLGNGSPGEIFEADFAIHLQHCHDLANAQRAVMGNKAQSVDVTLGTINGTTTVLWPTGKLYNLPRVLNQGPSHQVLPVEAIEDLKNKKKERVAQWFIPLNKSQPFLDFFVLVPVPDMEKTWQLRTIQNTVGKKHSEEYDQLKRIVGGVLDSGYNLCDKIITIGKKK